MKSRRLASLLILPVALLTGMSAGCATRQTVEQLEEKVRRLEEENFQLRKDLAEAGVRLELEAGEGRRAPGTRTVVRPPARRPAAESPAAEERVQDRPDSVIYSEPITDATPYLSAGPGRVGAAPAGPAGGVEASGAARSIMDNARRSLDTRDPEGALVHFREIVLNHPDDALADDAQFGIGECYFQMGRYAAAMAEYRRVIKELPFGDQVPYAHLKIGFAHLALEQRDLALQSFTTVSEGYPGTEAATVARQQIGHLQAGR